MAAPFIVESSARAPDFFPPPLFTAPICQIPRFAKFHQSGAGVSVAHFAHKRRGPFFSHHQTKGTIAMSDNKHVKINVDAYGKNAPEAAKFGRGTSTREGVEQAQNGRRNATPGEYGK